MSQAAAPQQPSLVQMALWVLYRYRIALGICCCIIALIAIFAGKHFGTSTWRTNITLQYTPLQVHDGQRTVYQAPNPPTMGELLRSTDYLDSAANKANLVMPSSILTNLLEVQIPPSSELIMVYLNWGSPSDAIDFLNALAQVAIEKRGQARNQAIDDAVKANEQQLKIARGDLAQVEAQFRKEFPNAAGQPLTQQIERLHSEVTASELALQSAQRQLTATQVKLKELTAQYQKMKAEQNNGTTEDPSIAAQNRDRLAKLRQQMMDDTALSIAEQQMKIKQREYETVKQLALKRAAPQIEVDRLAGELVVLQQTIDLNRKLRNELSTLDKEIVGPNGTRKPTQFDQEFASRKLEFDIAELGFRSEISQLEGTVRYKKDQRLDLEAQLRNAEPLQRQVDQARSNVFQIQGILHNLTSQRVQEQKELFVVAEASAGQSPFANSHRKWMLAIYVGLIGSLVAGLVAWEWFKLYRGFEGLAWRLGVPILARFGAMPQQDGPELAARLMESRRLAMRLCQAVPEPGSLVLVASPMKGRQVEQFTAELSRTLAHHEERVLILDMHLAGQDANEPTASMRSDPEYASSTSNAIALLEGTARATSLVRSTQLAAVDYLPIGHSERLAGVMAMTRLRQAIADVREIYTMIFMIAPPLNGDIDTEILGAFSQGVLIVTNDQASPGIMTHSIESLRAAQVPIIGAVLYPADEPVGPGLVVHG